MVNISDVTLTFFHCALKNRQVTSNQTSTRITRRLRCDTFGVTSNGNLLRIEKNAIPIPVTVFPFPFPSRPQPKPIPIPMGSPWESYSHGDSHSHAQLYCRPVARIVKTRRQTGRAPSTPLPSPPLPSEVSPLNQWCRKQFASGGGAQCRREAPVEIFLMCPLTFLLCPPHEGAQRLFVTD